MPAPCATSCRDAPGLRRNGSRARAGLLGGTYATHQHTPRHWDAGDVLVLASTRLRWPFARVNHSELNESGLLLPVAGLTFRRTNQFCLARAAQETLPRSPFPPTSARIYLSLCSPLCDGLIYFGVRSKGVIKGTNGESYTAFITDMDISQRIRASFQALDDDTSQRLLSILGFYAYFMHSF